MNPITSEDIDMGYFCDRSTSDKSKVAHDHSSNFSGSIKMAHDQSTVMNNQNIVNIDALVGSDSVSGIETENIDISSHFLDIRKKKLEVKFQFELPIFGS